MADISMCQNKNCKLSIHCKRFIAKANEFHQSYSIFIPEEKNGKTVCENYIETRSQEEVENAEKSN